MNDFKNLQSFINEANESTSTNAKIEVLKKYKDNSFIQKVFLYTYSPYLQFRVSSKNILKNSKLVAATNNYDSLFSLLDDLSLQVISGHDAIKAVNAFILANEEYKETILNIIDKGLKTRIDTTIINKIIPNCIPVFEVVLAHSYDESTKKKINWKDGWYVSRKLDGNRCICIVDANGEVEIKSRNGKDILTLQKIIDAVKTLKVRSVVFDGEICLVKENGDEDFAGIMREIRKKDHTIENPKYKIFDQLTLEEFQNLTGNTSLHDRQLNLKNTLFNYTGKELDLVEQTIILSDEDLENWSQHACTNGWEGVMIRKNCGYVAGRTNDLLKVKKFMDGEYVVEDIEVGPFRVVVDNMEVEEQVMRNVFISHKGYRVSVGSGFSLEQRRKYFKNPELLIGKEITVQYFEETENQQGGLSLRFPTVKAIYETGKRTDVE